MDETIVKKLVNDISLKMGSFLQNAHKFTNKAAARRARKESLKLGDMLKKFRSKSVK